MISQQKTSPPKTSQLLKVSNKNEHILNIRLNYLSERNNSVLGDESDLKLYRHIEII
jgi:hypothetical protein